MTAVGRMLCKSVCDDHLTGGGLASFVLEYLVHGAEARALSSPARAVEALAECDAELAEQWRGYLRAGKLPEGLELELMDFDPEAEEDVPVDATNLDAAVLAGCRHRLLTVRKGSLQALREGFTQLLDLSVQLAPLSAEQLALLVRGRVSFSASELVECFEWPQLTEAEAEAEKKAEEEAKVQGKPGATPKAKRAAREGAAAFVHAGSLLREVLSDAEAITEAQRLVLLQWATGRNALPKGGLQKKITLLPYESADEGTLPVVHTCTHEFHLPPWESKPVVAARLHTVLEHAGDGFQTN